MKLPFICNPVPLIGAVHLQELERRLALQEQDAVIVKNMKSEVTRLPELEREMKRLREENSFLRCQHYHHQTFSVMDAYLNHYLNYHNFNHISISFSERQRRTVVF